MLKLASTSAFFAFAVTLATCTGASAQTARFVPPPRTISDITAFLDQEKPDPAKRARTQAEANAEPPAKADRATLKDFYYRRSQARAVLGQLATAIPDAQQAAALAADYVADTSRIEAYQAQLMRRAGDYEGSVKLLERIAQRLGVTTQHKGRAFLLYTRIVISLISLGEIAKAEAYVNKTRALLAEARTWRDFDLYGSNWSALVEENNARISAVKGRYREAELAARKAQAFYRDALAKSKFWPNPRERDGFENAIDSALSDESRAKMRQGRLVEAEIDMRQALLSRLRAVGKYHFATGIMVYSLGWVLNEQGRFAECETLVRISLEIFDAIGLDRSSFPYVKALGNLGGALFAQRKYEATLQVSATIDTAIASWSGKRREAYRTGLGRIFSNYYVGNIAQGIEFARVGFTQAKALKGEQHYDTARARAALAAGLSFARRDAEAMQEYKAALPVLLGAAGPSDDDDATLTLNADRLLQTVLEPYMALLARSNAPDAAEESLRIADAIRSRAVQNALGAAAVRASAHTPELADLARKEQDLRKQIAAQSGLLRNVLEDAPENRQKEILDALQQELKVLRTQSEETSRDIRRRFPAYANLIRPAPVTAEEIRGALKPDEALVSFYFGERSSFAWAVPKSGPIAFAALPLTAPEMERKVAVLRKALDAEVEYIADMPNFDLGVAHDLYSALLEPVAAGWRDARQLVVVTNGGLGLLPLGLLPTAPANVDSASQPIFSSYRDVQWLARTHAVVSVPSASALRTLRGLAPASAKREPFIGFGDPIFSAEAPASSVTTASVNTTADATRGAKVGRRAVPVAANKRSVGLGDLQRLPDTADELKAIAGALQVDPAKTLHLGKAANEKAVLDADLSRYRIVAFATHGLKPGDLDGLNQPALALTAPAVAGIEGDGLLTVEDILALKLNADWVVLSACNTAAGADTGAEAVSGLGRAFFYAGSRALLATNWAVHSESARELVSDVFRRQAADPGLTRAEALRQAMVALLDSGTNKDQSGRVRFTYAHPFFWAPYSLIGDGG
jgi:CHAT domain-containing protein